MKRTFFLLAAMALGCSSSEEAATASDVGGEGETAVLDGAADTENVDTAALADSAVPDSAVPDSAVPDSPGEETRADVAPETLGDASTCNAMTFGVAAAPLTKVAMLPAMTGGTIVEGTYDAVEAKTTGSITGSYRATWTFLAGMKLDAIEQVVLSATPPAPSIRSFTWSAAGVSLTRTISCGGTMSFTNNYSVRSSAAGTFLDVRQDTLMFTFKKR